MRPMAKPGAAGDAVPPDILAMSFEQALAELDQIVQRLESGRVELEESIAIYARGAQLKRHCESKLKQAAERIEAIVVGEDGSVGTRPAATE
ncbi:MAG: exodeoxyribonuclease VII small subunit [Alphaproteobacteria bacterium]|nr:exodeoxyribonuclease VII small subunit [Alphaproteobacteria bacterium]